MSRASAYQLVSVQPLIGHAGDELSLVTSFPDPLSSILAFHSRHTPGQTRGARSKKMLRRSLKRKPSDSAGGPCPVVEF